MLNLEFYDKIIDHYPFDGNVTCPFGLSKGIIQGAELCLGVTDRPDNAYDFKDPSHRIEISRDPEWNENRKTTKQMSVSWWAKYPVACLRVNYPHFFCQHATRGKPYVFRSHVLGPAYQYRERYKIVFFFNNKKRFDLYTVEKPTPGVWHHYVATFDSEEGLGHLYLDNKIQTSVPVSGELPLDFGTLSIGEHPTMKQIPQGNPHTSYIGQIGEIIIFNSSLSEVEVDYLFNQKGQTRALLSRRPLDETFGERFETLTGHTDFSFQLSNKSLSLWKPLFYESSVKNITDLLSTSTSCDILKNLSLDVDEEVILLLLLGVDISSKEDSIMLSKSNVLDYFLFFRGVGLQRGVNNLIMWLILHSHDMTFEDLFFLFKSCVLDHESEDIKTSFYSSSSSSSTSKKDELVFTTFFCESLFHLMKSRESETNVFESILREKSFLSILKSFSSEGKNIHSIVKETLSHREIPLFQSCFQKKDESGDLSLISSDGKVFRCHRMILMLNSNFFHQMIRFGGQEAMDMQNSGKIQLHDIDSHLLSYLLPLYYRVVVPSQKFQSQRGREDFLVVLLKCIIHCEKFLETKHVKFLLSSLSSLCKDIEENNEEKSVESAVRKIGYLLSRNDVLIETVAKCVTSGLDVEIVKKWVNESAIDHRFDVLEKENQRLKDEIKELRLGFEKRISRLEEELLKGNEKKKE